MGISGSDRAGLYSQFGVMRFGASRFGGTSPRAFVSVGGVHRANGKDDPTIKLDNLSITETRSSTPNKASFTAKGNGWEPTVGMEVIATMGSKNRIRRLYGGTVIDVTETSKGQLREFKVNCVDWNWLLDDEPIYGHFTGTYDEIALQLMADAPAGFTTRQVEAGLPTVTGGITFTGVKRSVALKRLEKRGANLGLVQFIDYNKDLYFRVTPSPVLTAPREVTNDRKSVKQFIVRRDIGQVANRVPFEGGGANTLAEVAAGETILPLTDAPEWWYGDVGGVVLSGPQRITYTARVEGGGGSVVGPGVSPTGAPTAALAAGSGVDTGSHVISFVWKTATGRTLPGATTTIVVGLVSAPTAGPTAGTPSSGGSMDLGTHTYYPVFRTAAGATTTGPASNTVTVALTAAPTTIGTADYNPSGGYGSMAATSAYAWKYTFRRLSDGAETTASPATNSVITSPDVGPGPNTALVCRVDLSGCQAPPSGYERKWYRTEANGGTYKVASGAFGEGSGYFHDGGADASLGAVEPSTNTTTNGTCLVSNIPISPSPLVTHVDMYRTHNGAYYSNAQLVFSVANGVTSYSDTLANSGKGGYIPLTNTAAANQIALSGIAVGPSGTTERDVYMSPVGGGTRRLALNIPNNTATTGTITMSDATLAGQAAEPVVDTSGLTQPSGQVLPGATSIVISGTAPFLAGGGWAFTGTQQVRYTGFTGGSLTGIPASGIGSITQPISYGVTIAAAPSLTGIPASGDGAIIDTIPKGEAVNLYVTVEDTDAQADLQARVSAAAPVVRECPRLQDRRLSRDEALTRASAFLSVRAYPSVAVGPYLSKDTNNRAGLEVPINITAPMQVNDTFKIQEVTITNFTHNIPPDYLVTASDELFSIEDILSREPA